MHVAYLMLSDFLSSCIMQAYARPNSFESLLKVAVNNIR